jgi:hypothetical protein
MNNFVPSPEARDRALAILAKRHPQPISAQTAASYSEYADDPVGFGRDVLHHEYPPDVCRLMEAVVEYPWVIAKSATGIGKSWAAGVILLWWVMCRPDALAYAAAAPPLSNLEGIIWRYMLHFVAEHKLPVQPHPQLVEYGRNRITGVVIPQDANPDSLETRASGKHAPNLLYLLDEANAIPDPFIKGADGCLSGEGMQRLVAFYNPRSDEGMIAQREKAGTAHVVTMSAFGHPNVTTGRAVFPGAASRDITVARINKWSRPAQGGKDLFDVPQFLVGSTAPRDEGGHYDPLPAGPREITDSQLAYKVLARYPLGGVNSYYDAEHLRSLVLPAPLEVEVSPGVWRRTLQPGDKGLSGWLQIFEEPGDSVIAIGADVSEGIESDDHDWHAADGFDCATGAQVLTYWGRGDIYQYARDLMWLSERWNSAAVGPAMLIVERNGPGLGVCKELEAHGAMQYSRQVTREVGGRPITAPELGFVTTPATKALVDSTLQAGIALAAQGGAGPIIRGERCRDQLVHYVNLSGGKRGGEGNYHDDHVRSVALSWWWLCEYGRAIAESVDHSRRVAKLRRTGDWPEEPGGGHWQ